MSNEKITLQAPGSQTTITTRDEKQASNLVASGWARLAAGATAPKPAAPKPKTTRASAKKPAAKPAADTPETEDDGSEPEVSADDNTEN